MKVLIAVVIFFAVFSKAYAGPYTAKMQKACPDGWQNTKRTVPVVSTSAWEQNETGPWNKDALVTDKTQAKTNLQNTDVIKTIDTDYGQKPDKLIDYLIADPLTVASECLKYRNFTVDTMDYVAPPDVPHNPNAGWVPAVMF